MPDLLAGTTVQALDTPVTVENTQNGNFTFNSTSYGVDSDAGTYVDCGVAFVAPTTGRVLILWKAQMDHDTAGQFGAISPVVRTGSTVGAGATVTAAADTRALIQSGTDVLQIGTHDLVSGLTPGDTYNVRLEHKTGGGNATFERRRVTVVPCT